MARLGDPILEATSLRRREPNHELHHREEGAPRDLVDPSGQHALLLPHRDKPQPADHVRVPCRRGKPLRCQWTVRGDRACTDQRFVRRSQAMEMFFFQDLTIIFNIFS